VLTVRTDRGDLVLDNLTARLRTADQTDYTWVKRQSAIHPALWVRLGGYTASRAAKAAASRPAKANAATRSSRSAKISAAAKSPIRIAQTEPAAAGGLNLRGTFGDDAAVP
jgi:hypothetical protein